MSRWVWRVMAGLGVLCFVAALVVRIAVAPLAAQAPLVPGSDGFLNHVSIGTVTALLDLESGATRDPIRVTRTETTRGDAATALAARDEGFNVGVYTTLTRVVGPDQKVIREDNYRLAADRRSSALVDCCGAFVGGVVVPMAGAGYPLRFPANVARATYPFFDVNLLASVPMEYLGTDRAGGVDAYKFQQATAPTKVGRLVVPGKLVGSTQEKATADRMYSVTRTLWVDPISGIILRKSERTRETLRDGNGRDVLTLYSAVLDSSVEQTQAEVAAARSAGRAIVWSRTLGPLLLLGLGVVLLAGAGAGLAHARRMDRLHEDFPDNWATFDDLTSEHDAP